MRIDAHNYEKMRTWLVVVCPDVFPGLTPKTDPIDFLDRTFATSPANARKGLAMAISDIVDLTDDWPAARVAAIDHILTSEGLPTLTEMRLNFSKVIRRVMSRGSIKNEVEYYAVRNAVELTEHEEALWKLLTEFEDKAVT